MGNYYLTSPIYYVNANPHIGHAYTNIICDCMARFMRMKEEGVFFLTGTDEHGEKIEKAAGAEGASPDGFIAAKADIFKKLWQMLDVSYDFFIRTSWPPHTEAVKKIIKLLYEKGDIYKSSYSAFYCISCETFWTRLQLGDSKNCPECGRVSEEISEENYFFKLSKYQEWFKEYLGENPEFIRPRVRYNEIRQFLEDNPLNDLCISRPKKRVKWGIDFPLDSGYVVYVWFDALINYLSGIGYGFDKKKFAKFWPADIHFIGKDILRHHAVFWPIMLKAIGLKQPKCIFAHGWWKIAAEKMSKSKGNIVNPFELVARLSGLLDSGQELAVDALRYFLLREVPVGLDGNFSLKSLISRINSDLANDLGNLVYRSINMAQKYRGGEVGCGGDIPSCFCPSLENLGRKYDCFFAGSEFHKALDCVFEFIAAINKYIEDTKPWVLFKEKKENELGNFLYAVLEGIRLVSVYLYPVMPKTSFLIQEQLGAGSPAFSLREAEWKRTGSFLVKKEKPLFPRVDFS